MATALKLRKLKSIVNEIRFRMSEIDEILAEAVHGPDFASVRWFGKEYTFTATQAAVVRVLWKAWEEGTPAVRQETLLEASASAADRVADIFTDSDAWGEMVQPGVRKGTFRLVELENI